MNLSEVARDFDHHVEAAYTALDTALYNEPELITPEREKELRNVVDNLYLPNIDFRGNAFVNTVNTPDDRVAFLPFKSSEFVDRLLIDTGNGNKLWTPFPDSDGGLRRMSTTWHRVEHPNSKKFREYVFAIAETVPKDRAMTWSMLGAATLHEATHVNQVFRPATTEPQPRVMQQRPRLRTWDTNYDIRNEVESYWLEDIASDPRTREHTKARADRLSNIFMDLKAGKEPKNFPRKLDALELVKSMLELGLVSADEDPDPENARYLLAAGIV